MTKFIYKENGIEENFLLGKTIQWSISESLASLSYAIFEAPAVPSTNVKVHLAHSS